MHQAKHIKNINGFHNQLSAETTQTAEKLSAVALKITSQDCFQQLFIKQVLKQKLS